MSTPRIEGEVGVCTCGKEDDEEVVKSVSDLGRDEDDGGEVIMIPNEVGADDELSWSRHAWPCSSGSGGDEAGILGLES